MWGIALLLSCLFSLYFRTADEHGVVWLGLGKILPLHRSSVIQETLNPRAANQGRLLWLFYENLQQTPKTFFFSTLFFSPAKKKKKIFLAEYFLQSLSHSLSFSTNVPNLLILFLHQQAINQLWCSCQRFSAHSFAGTGFLFACHR